MKLSSPLIKKIIEIQDMNNIKQEKLVLLSLAISDGKLSVIKTIIDSYDINKEELRALIDLLEKEDILSSNDMKLINKLDKTKIIEPEDFEHMVEEVISHLNAITHTKRRITKLRKNIIIKYLRQGYTIEQFIKVNLLFYYKWHEDPNMEQYIRPETLYNGKFPERVEDAEKEFLLIDKYQNEIKTICETYQHFFENFIINPSLKYKTEIDFLEIVDNKCKFMPFELQQRIAFWLKKGFSIENILMTIEATIVQWSKKIELYPYINLMKILDRKFPERANIAVRLIESQRKSMRNENVMALEEWASN